MESLRIAILATLMMLILSFQSIRGFSDKQTVLPLAEQESVYHVLESINSEIDWRSLYPDDLCLSGPHGVVCDLFPDLYGELTPHIAELNFGYVSDFSSNPPCGPNSTFSSRLSSFPFLRKLFFYRCFNYSNIPLPAHFWNLFSSLEELVFLGNPSLVGYLSGRIGEFTHLRRLVLSGSGVSGNIPDEIGNLLRLEQLVLSQNRFRGGIPESTGGCLRLKILDMSGNRISGHLPAEIGRLVELVKLDLSLNRISGPVPVELSRLQSLEFLDVSYNNLSGGLPISLAEMGALKEVYLSGNRLGGSIPEIWEKLGGMLRLGMSGLGLMGNIPSSMGEFLGNVCYLGLDNNLLEGEVPEQFKRLEGSAREINLENNKLSGRIPFSPGFVRGIGVKLKLAGNPELCVDGDLVGHYKGKGHLRYMKLCSNRSELPQPVLFYSGSSLLRSSFDLFFIFLHLIYILL